MHYAYHSILFSLMEKYTLQVLIVGIVQPWDIDALSSRTLEKM